MPQERDFIDILAEKLTAPLRITPAALTLLENITDPVEAFTRSWRVFLNPTEARPEDLHYVSKRYFNMDPGFTSFLIDTASDLGIFWGLSRARGHRALFHRGKLTPIGEESYEQHGISNKYDKLTSNFPKIWADEGWEKGSKAYLLASEMAKEIEVAELSKLDRAMQVFKNRNGEKALEEASHNIGLYRSGMADKLTRALTPDEVELNSAFQGIYDSMYDRVRVLEKISNKKKGGGIGIGTDPIRDKYGISADVELEAANYDPLYMTRMLDDTALLNRGDAKTIRDLVTNPGTAMGRLVGQMQKAGQINVDKIGSSIGSLYEKSRAVWEELQGPAGKEVFAPFMFRRKWDAEKWAKMEQYAVLDPFAVATEYIHRGARTIALHTPLSAEQAAMFSGRAIGEFIDAPGILQDLNRQSRMLQPLARQGDQNAILRLAQIDKQSSDLVKGLKFDQRSIMTQLKVEAVDRFINFDPFDPQPLSRNFLSRPEAATFMEYLDDLTGKSKLEDSFTTNRIAGMISGMRRSVSRNEGTINSVGGSMGFPTVGTDLANYLSRHGTLRGSRNLEESAIKLTSLAAFALRPAAAAMQLTQIPTILAGEIGFGNALMGTWDAISTGKRILGEAWRQNKVLNYPTMALKQAIRTVAPELEQWGLTTDLHLQDLSRNKSFWDAPVFKWSMSAFTGGEMVNRMASFYGGRRLIMKKINNNIRHGMDFHTAATKALGQETRGMIDRVPVKYLRDEDLFAQNPTTGQYQPAPLGHLVDLHAARITDKTQFVPRPGGRTRLQASVIKSPVWKQFLGYGLGFRNWITDAAFRVAAKEMDNIGGLFNAEKMSGQNGQAFMRWLLAINGLTHFTGDVLGLDFGEKTAAGILPLPLSDKTIFSPIPVPPVPGMVFQGLKVAAGGEFDRSQLLNLPGVGTTFIPKMLVPGGQFISQASKVFNQTKGGVYQDSNGRGLEHLDDKDRWLRTFGFTGQDSRRDALKLDQAAAIQRKISQAKWEMARALANGDTRQAAKVQAQVSGDPQLKGYKVQVGPGDVKRAHQMQQEIRLDRGLRAVGPTVTGILERNEDGYNAGYRATGISY